MYVPCACLYPALSNRHEVLPCSAGRVSAELPGVACFGCFGSRGQLCLSHTDGCVLQLAVLPEEDLEEMTFLSPILNLLSTKV